MLVRSEYYQSEKTVQRKRQLGSQQVHNVLGSYGMLAQEVNGY